MKTLFLLSAISFMLLGTAIDGEVSKLSDLISYDETDKEIKAIIRHDTLGGLVKNYALGGTFPVEAFFPKKERDTRKGAMLWLCFNSGDLVKRHHSLFAATEILMASTVEDIYKKPGNEQKPVSNQLFYPCSTFNADKYLSAVDLSTCGSTLSVDKETVFDYSGSFAALMKKYDIGNERIFHESAWAYFQNNKAQVNDTDGVLTRLVNQPGVEYINYYFAYDSKYKAKNTLRIILIGVDGKGNLIVPKGNRRESATNSQQSGNIIVQKSIPPVD